MDALWYIVLIVEQVARANALSTFATFEINKLYSKLVILYIHVLCTFLSRMHWVMCETFHLFSLYYKCNSVLDE